MLFFTVCLHISVGYRNYSNKPEINYFIIKQYIPDAVLLVVKGESFLKAYTSSFPAALPIPNSKDLIILSLSANPVHEQLMSVTACKI